MHSIETSYEMLEKLHNQFLSLPVIDFRVPTLNSQNWDEWKFKMMAQFKCYKILPIVIDEWPEVIRNTAKFREMDDNAQDLIKLNVNSLYFKLLFDSSSANEAFTRLIDHFEGNESARTIRIFNDLFQNQTKKSENLDEIVIKFRKNYHDLKSIYPNLPDAMMLSLLIASLPDSMEYLAKRVMNEAKYAIKSLDEILDEFSEESHYIRIKRIIFGQSNRSMATVTAINDNQSDDNSTIYNGDNPPAAPNAVEHSDMDDE